jgi:hypothetical protein
MAERESMGSNVDASLIQRVVTGVKYLVTGVTPTSWFGPSQPLAPQAQKETEGRQLDYPVGVNLRMQPREGEAVSFGQLRALADGYDLMRLVIETRKDQVESYEWEILPADKRHSLKDDIELQAKVDAVTEFLQNPNREHNWSQWLRQIVEEILVIDAVCIYPRETMGGQMYGFELVDGATVKRVIDDTGRTPMPPSVAYQQILKGIPAGDYSSDQLIYIMRNPRVSRLYGFSPVEQVITTVNIAIRRQMSQLAFYTEGNVPEAIAQTPETWTLAQVKDFQAWWDSIMEGNQSQKRKMRFVPSLKDIVFPKDAVLKDEMDEWLARIVCFAFSISPTALIKQVNRASGEQMSDTAKEEGLLPLLRFLQAFITMLIQKHLGLPELRFAWKLVNKVDPKAQSDIHTAYIDKQVLTADEVREDLGREKMTPEERESAFPKPPALDPFGNPIEGGPPAVDKDGKPLAGAAAAAGGGKVLPFGKKPAADPAEPTAVEKMLADALRMLDPGRLAELLEKSAAAQAPRIVEVRPEVEVNVGDTNVHVPAPNVTVPLAKAAPHPHDDKQLRSTRQADGSMLATWEPKP